MLPCALFIAILIFIDAFTLINSDNVYHAICSLPTLVGELLPRKYIIHGFIRFACRANNEALVIL